MKILGILYLYFILYFILVFEILVFEDILIIVYKQWSAYIVTY